MKCVITAERAGKQNLAHESSLNRWTSSSPRNFGPVTGNLLSVRTIFCINLSERHVFAPLACRSMKKRSLDSCAAFKNKQKNRFASLFPSPAVLNIFTVVNSFAKWLHCQVSRRECGMCWVELCFSMSLPHKTDENVVSLFFPLIQFDVLAFDNRWIPFAYANSRFNFQTGSGDHQSYLMLQIFFCYRSNGHHYSNITCSS